MVSTLLLQIKVLRMTFTTTVFPLKKAQLHLLGLGFSSRADEKFSFKYSPGKLRGNQYKTMMTKEELEEEQRVQREQLAAIFTLLKEKSDTFGDMSESDIKEQLKLYDM
uniref:Matrix-remodeling-associated protein 7 helical domain-containing protein n=1 Tax=Laticauda laticaudata TaxID=8630 RepID=A0A8C5WXH3_LATLA